MQTNLYTNSFVILLRNAQTDSAIRIRTILVPIRYKKIKNKTDLVIFLIGFSFPLLVLLIHTFSVLSLQLKKLRWHNKSAIDLSNANPACGHKAVPRSTGHIMVTTRYSDQQGSQSRQKGTWYATLQAMAPTNIKTVHQTSLLHIESSLDRLGLLSPTHDQRSQQQSGQFTLQQVLINKSKLFKATHRTKVRKIEIPRSMVVETLSWWSRRASQHPVV